MLDIRRHRHVFNPERFPYPVHIFGCGGMGSRVAEGLVRMGLGIPDVNPITLYDDDRFEEHNLANQFVSQQHLFCHKVVAVRNMLREINPHAMVQAHVERVQRMMQIRGLVFMCVDSMEARRILVEEVVCPAPEVDCVIETRLDAGVGVSHCFDPKSARQLACWRMYWHSDQEAEDIAGCDGPQSIISAIYGTTALALKQLEQYAQTCSTATMANRVYHDFDACIIRSESWPIT